MLHRLQAGASGTTVLVSMAAGGDGSQFRGRWVWFTDLRAGLSQQCQGTLFSIQLDAHWSGAQRLEILRVKYVTRVSGQHFENPYRQPLFLTRGITVGQRGDRVGPGF